MKQKLFWSISFAVVCVKIHVLRQTADVNLYHVTKFSTYSPFILYCFYTKISSFMPDITIGIVWDCFYLLIFYSEKFSTWVWRLQFEVNVNLNLSNISGGIPNAHLRETKTWTVFWHQQSTCNKQVSTLGILILRKHKLLRHLNPSQSCNGFRLYFGVSARFNMIPFNWFLR